MARSGCVRGLVKKCFIAIHGVAAAPMATVYEQYFPRIRWLYRRDRVEAEIRVGRRVVQGS